MWCVFCCRCGWPRLPGESPVCNKYARRSDGVPQSGAVCRQAAVSQCFVGGRYSGHQCAGFCRSQSTAHRLQAWPQDHSQETSGTTVQLLVHGISHKLGGRLPLLSAITEVTFPISERIALHGEQRQVWLTICLGLLRDCGMIIIIIIIIRFVKRQNVKRLPWR